MTKRADARPRIVRHDAASSRGRAIAAALRSASAFACLAVAGGPAVAQQLFWDTNGATTGSGNAGGTWDEGTTAVWSTSSAGTVATTTFPGGNAATAVFAAGTDFSGTGRVITVSGTVAPAGIVFESEVTSMSLTGGTIAFNATTGLLDASALGSGTGKQVSIATALTGTAGITVVGNGNLTAGGGGSNAYFDLAGDNSGLTGGIAVTGGLLSFTTAAAAGTNTITLSNFGGILDRNLNLQLANNIVVQSTGGTFRLYGSNLTTNFSGSISGTGAINRTDGGTLTLSGSGAGYSGTYNNQAGTTVFTTTDWGSAKFNLTAGTLTYNPATAGAVVTVNDLTAVGTVNVLNDAVLDVTSGAVRLRSTGTAAVARGTGAGAITSSSGTLTITSVDANGATTTGSLGTNTHTFSAFVANAGPGGATPVAVVKNGVNDVTFSAANTYSGGTTINAGRLNASNAAGFGTGPVTVNSGGQAFLSTGTGTYANAFTIAGLGQPETAGTLGAIRLSGGANVAGLVTLAADSRINAHGGTGTLSGGIAQAGGARALEFGGSSSASTVTLTAAATYTGATTISNATVNVGTTAAPAAANLLAATSGFQLGAAAGTGSGALNFNVAASYTLGRPVAFNTAGSTLGFYSPNATDVVTVTSALGTVPANGFLQANGAELRFADGSSAQAQTFSVTSTPANSATAALGRFTVQAGAALTTQYFNIGNGSNTAGVVNQTGGTVTIQAGGTGFRLGHWTNGTLTPGSQYNLTGGTLDATAMAGNAAGSAQFVNVGWDGLATMTVGGGAGTATLKAYGVQLDANADTATANDTLTVAANGVVEVGAGGLAGASAADKLILLNGATLRGTATGTWSAATDTTAGGTTTLDVASGATVTLTSALTGTGTLAKTGTGTLLVNTALQAGMGLTMSGGTVQVNMAAASGVTTAVNGGTLTGTAAVGDLTVGPAGTLRPGANANDGTIGTMNAASLNFNGGTARFDLSGSSTATGGTTNDLIAVVGTATFAGGTIQPVFSGPVAAGNVYTLVTSGGLSAGTLPTVDPVVTGNSRLGFAVGTSGNNLTLTVSGTAKALKWTGGTDATWNTNASQNWQDAAPNDEKFFTADTVTFDAAGASAPTVTLAGSLAPGSTTVNATTDYTFTGTGSIVGGSLSKAGTGTLTILTNNSYTGTTTVTAGRVAVGNGGTSGSLGVGAVALSSGTKLAFNRSDAATVTNVISGAGGVEFVGTGSTAMAGTSSYTGGTLVTRGTVIAQADFAFGTGTLTIGDATTGSQPITISIENRADLRSSLPIVVTANGTGPVVFAGSANVGTGAAPTTIGGQLTLNR
ncbi:MAG TPA: autotransporter-associated beta strand repeat-containing protein, partial [Humisphaera sp.]